MIESRIDATEATGEGVGEKDRRAVEWSLRVWRQLLDMDAKIYDDKNIRLLTPEARVLIHLKLNGPVSVTTAMQVAGTSHRGFYGVLERLRQAGVVATVKDDQDQRVRKLSLDPSAPIETVKP